MSSALTAEKLASARIHSMHCGFLLVRGGDGEEVVSALHRFESIDKFAAGEIAR